MSTSIRSDITIDAPAERVWSLLADLASYPDWNPFIRRAEGTLAQGEQLRLELQIPDGMRMKIRPRLITVVEQAQIRWIGHLVVPGLFDGDHRFVLTPLAPACTRLVQQETFNGALVPVFGGWIGAGARRGFEAMNRAAKARLGG
jgi:hypothetical protein